MSQLGPASPTVYGLDWSVLAGIYSIETDFGRLDAPGVRSGENGYSSHGSPRTCSGGCPAHIHVSWVSGCYGSGELVAPCAWVMAFPVPGEGSEGTKGETPNAA